MAVDVEKLDFEISARDKASEVIRGVSRTVGDLQASYARLAAITGVGFVATGLVSMTAQSIQARSALDDLADTTGDYVKTLDGLRRQAEISGVAFDSVGGALTKFARNLDSADDDGKAAAAAIAAVGLSITDLQALKPGEAMLEVARALGRFEDGAGKVRVAVALMGKEGASMLPYLKDLAETGELNGRITNEQAAAAEKLEKQWRGVVQVLRDGREAIANLLIPELSEKIQQMQEGIRLFGIAGSVLNLGLSIDPTKGLAENLRETRGQLAALAAEKERMATRGDASQAGWYDQQMSRVGRQLEFLQLMERQRALRGAGEGNLDARDLMARGGLPTLNFTPPGKDPRAAPGPKKTEEEIRLAREFTEIYGDLTLAIANAEQARRREAEAMEAQALGLQAVGGMSAAVAAGLKSDAELEKMSQRWRDVADPLEKYRRELEDIAELESLMYLTAEQASSARQSVYAAMLRESDQTLKTVKETDDWARQMGLTFNSAFEDAILRGNDFRSVLAAIGQDIARIMLRKSVTEPLGSAASGFFGNLFGNLFGPNPELAAAGSMHTPGFANGGDFTVGGSGGTDSQLVQFRATPGEMVSVRTPGQAAGGGDTYYIDARGADSAGLARLEATITALNGSIERRAVSAVMDAKLRGGAAARVLA